MKRKSRIMYLGKKLNSLNQLRYKYVEINTSNELADEWTFNKKIFTKGTVGSIYDCEFKGSTISYNKSTIPTSFIIDEKGTLTATSLKFSIVNICEEESRQVEISINNSKKPQSNIDKDIKNLKEIYKQLAPNKRASYIANVVYKITS